MSIRAMNWAWSVPGLNPTQRLLLLKLADVANDEGGSLFPSRAYLAEKVGVSESTVIRTIRQLKAQGLLDAQERHDANGRQRSNNYRLAIRHPVGEGVRLTPPGGCQIDTGEGVTPDTPLSVSNEKDVCKGAGEPDQDPLGLEPPPDGFASWFDAFWSAYPKDRRTAKKTARDKWTRRKLERMGPQLVADVERRKAHCRRWVRGFAPMPATYINQDRWEDELEEMGPVPTTTPGQAPSFTTTNRGQSNAKDTGRGRNVQDRNREATRDYFKQRHGTDY